ncbi:hypothetical protein KUV80_15435 [Fictibacillus nanhaiensis]|uniref:hypothetical protein n=1 Tax=Fictibacillus nanhaiensis TaxID=742169 RepID=UPI001C94CEF1|nr:hypothetical protein [Fictibacillus nanhaiensis]MBY6038067.1 hypothetical protein [Fictibacillus nanhaiensis]
MKRIFLLVLSLIILFISEPIAVNASDEKAVFVRKDGLWLKDGEVERKIVEGGKVFYPKFSSDGIYVSYLSGDSKELWIYNRVTRLKRRVFAGDAYMPRWAPVGQKLAWKSGSVLNVINLSEPTEPFENVALGVGNYSWTSDGKGFIISSSAHLEPDGWSAVQIFTVPADAKGDQTKIKRITTLPKRSDTFFAIGTTEFKWSARSRQYAFIACPTASMSADSNTLMTVTKYGSETKMAGNMLSDPNWFHWSPKDEKLAFIKGIGRLTSENKKLTYWQADSGKEVDLGIEGFADGDFTWRSDKAIIVSRQIEWGWNVPEEKRPHPFLAIVNVKDGSAKKITKPEKGVADVYPKTMPGGEIVWIRTGGSMKKTKVMKKKNADSKEEVWIDHLKEASDCYGWQCVLDVYKAR